jgi:hypothetical protein
MMNELRSGFFSPVLFILVTGLCLAIWPPNALRAQTKPLSYPEIITALNTKLPNSAFKNKPALIDWLIGQVRQRKVEKSLSQEMEGTLRQSGATDELIRAIRSNVPGPPKIPAPVTFTKLYSEMNDSEKLRFVEYKVDEFLNKFGQSEGNKVPAEGIAAIKSSIDGYLRRLALVESSENDDQAAPGNCNIARGSLASVFRRGIQNSSLIGESFHQKGIQPEIGIYLGFLESEFCPCLQSPTGPLGMFQFPRELARAYGLSVKEDASPDNPDERCNPKAASRGAASYFRELIDRYYGADANGILFSIAAYNSGQGTLNRNIKTLRERGQNNVTFWDLMAHKDKMTEQFRTENVKYVPKFLAALIIGENPKSFGIVEFQPLSSLAPRSSSSPAGKSAGDDETAFWQKQRGKALEPRRQPTGLDLKGLIVPPELTNGQSKQANALNQMKAEGFVAPMDFFELAERNLTGEFVELPLATDDYLLEIGGQATGEEFARFSFPDGKKIVPADSAEFGSLKRYAGQLSGPKYDLNDSADRKKIRQRLLRMLTPKAKAVLDETAREYRAKFGRPLRVTSLIRSVDYQVELNRTDASSFIVRGEGSLPPHCSGLAFDFAYKHMTAEEQNFLSALLARMEREGRIEVVREGGVNAAFHVFVL